MPTNRLVERIKQGEPDDAIWKEAIDLGELIETNYDLVLRQTLEATGAASHDDTLAAISTCLLEHLLESDFSGFELVAAEIEEGNEKLYKALYLSRKMGLSKLPQNAARWDDLIERHRIGKSQSD